MGGQPGKAEHPTPDAPHNGQRYPPRGRPSATPTARNAGKQGRARCGAGAGSPRPHQPHPGHTDRGTPAARPRGRAAGGGTAPDTRRASQRWQATTPGDGPPPPPRHAAPTGHASEGDSAGPPHPHTRAHSIWVADPDSLPRGRTAWGGGAPDLRRPSQQRKAAPPGDALPQPSQRATPAARAHARCGDGAGSARPRQPHPGHTGCGTPAARPRRQAAGGGTAPDTRRSSEQWQDSPPRDSPQPPPRHAAITGRASQGDSAGPPHLHDRAHSTWVADPDSPPGGRAAGGGGAPDLRRRTQRRTAPPRGRPSAAPTARINSSQDLKPVLGPNAHTNRTQDTRVAEPRPPVPEDGRQGGGQRLTPDASLNGRRPTPPGTAPHHPAARSPTQSMRAKGTVLGPYTRTPAPTARG